MSAAPSTGGGSSRPTSPSRARPTAVTDPAALPWDGPADHVLVALKAQHTDGAARLVRSPVRARHPGGLGPERDRGGRAATTHTRRTRPSVPVGRVLRGRTDRLLATSATARSARLIVPDEPAGPSPWPSWRPAPALRIDPSPGQEVSAWVKLGINSVANGLTALTGQADGGHRPRPGIRDDRPPTCSPSAGPSAGPPGSTSTSDTVDRQDPGRVWPPGTPRAVGPRCCRTAKPADRPSIDAIHGAVHPSRRTQRRCRPPMTRIVHDLLAAGDPS